MGEAMKNFLIVILILGAAAAGCGRETPTSPEPQRRSWDQVVLAERHAPAGDPASEISVRSDGVLTLVFRPANVAVAAHAAGPDGAAGPDDSGDTVSSRGLLTGQRLDALSDLVDALPAGSYASPVTCPTGGFLLTVKSAEAVRIYSFGACDSANAEVPESARLLQEYLSELGASTQAPRLVVVPFQVLLQGTQSAVHQPTRLVLQDRDALAHFLREHAPDRPVAVPAVDFGRQIVIAEWLGDRPSTEHSVELEVAEITQTAWFRLRYHRYTPGPDCAVAAQITQPFVLVALDRHPEEMLFEDVTTEMDCMSVSPVGGE